MSEKKVDGKPKEFMEDPRYKQCNKEAFYGIVLGVINMIWWYGFGYGLGSKPVEEYKYILGFPSWFFYSCILSVVVFVGATYFMVNVLFEEDMPLDDMTEEEAREYREKHSRGGRP